MQTFLIHESFLETARALDTRRLNKQVVECKQIYASLTGMSEPYGKPAKQTNSWQHHPAVRMWKGAEHLLCVYAIIMREEATRRKIRDNTEMLKFFEVRMNRHPFIIPSWWSEEAQKSRIIFTHRCNLARKDWKHYFPQFKELKAGDVFTTPYHWPVQTHNVRIES